MAKFFGQPLYKWNNGMNLIISMTSNSCNENGGKVTEVRQWIWFWGDIGFMWWLWLNNNRNNGMNLVISNTSNSSDENGWKITELMEWIWFFWRHDIHQMEVVEN